MDKPFSQACENNKKPILDVIGPYYDKSELVLEIGSGTGQHAVYFAEHLKDVFWQTSDQVQYHEGINLWVNGYNKYNLGRPLKLNVLDNKWPIESCHGVFSANTAHIMNWEMVEKMFEGVGDILLPDKKFCLYGPFNFNGQYTSASNQAFDQMLKQRDPESGIRDFEALRKLAEKEGLKFIDLHEMPANNKILVWSKENS